MTYPSAAELIANARAEIDAIDRLMVELLIRRCDVASRIGAVKREQGLPVFDPAREAKLLSRLAEQARPPLTPEVIATVWKSILEASRAVQHRF